MSALDWLYVIGGLLLLQIASEIPAALRWWRRRSQATPAPTLPERERGES